MKTCWKECLGAASSRGSRVRGDHRESVADVGLPSRACEGLLESVAGLRLTRAYKVCEKALPPVWRFKSFQPTGPLRLYKSTKLSRAKDDSSIAQEAKTNSRQASKVKNLGSNASDVGKSLVD